MNKLIDVKEHSFITNEKLDDSLNIKFNSYFNNEKDPKYLCLHQDPKSLLLQSYYYIGYRWLNKTDYIHVSSKEYAGRKANYMSMFIACMNDPIVSKKLDDTYKIFFDEPWIDIEGEVDELTPLLILHFLKVVKRISQKGLKQGYIKVTENMTSKTKGKILVNQTIRKNHYKNRLDKTVCSHQIFTIDCIENQIIKTALSQCGRQLKGIVDSNIVKLLKQNLNTFELVNNKDILHSDFSTIKHSPFYKEYKEAILLAKMIFKRFGFTLESRLENNKHKIPPFYINMPELFERYVEVILRKEYKHNLVPGYSQKEGQSYKWGLRPDFIVTKGNLIIDAKYKYWFEDCSDCVKLKDDFQQLSLYGRVSDIRNQIGLEKNEEAVLLFIYPSHDETDKELNIKKNENKIKENFSKIIKIPLYIPNTGK